MAHVAFRSSSLSGCFRCAIQEQCLGMCFSGFSASCTQNAKFQMFQLMFSEALLCRAKEATPEEPRRPDVEMVELQRWGSLGDIYIYISKDIYICIGLIAPLPGLSDAFGNAEPPR